MHVKAVMSSPKYRFDMEVGALTMARVALVTGGTRGIGAAASQALQAEASTPQ